MELIMTLNGGSEISGGDTQNRPGSDAGCCVVKEEEEEEEEKEEEEKEK